MSENSIIIELNSKVSASSKNISKITAALEKLYTASTKALEGIKALSASMNEASAAADNLLGRVTDLSGGFRSVGSDAKSASKGFDAFVKKAREAESAARSLMVVNNSMGASTQNWSYGRQYGENPVARYYGFEYQKSLDYSEAVWDTTEMYKALTGAVSEATEAKRIFDAEYEVIYDQSKFNYGGWNVNGQGSSEASWNTAMPSSVGTIAGSSGEFKATEKAIAGVSKEAKSAEKSISRLGASAKRLLSSIGRIAFYRAIRSAIKAVTSSYQEGVSHLYQYSAAMNSLDTHNVKSNMDSLATTSLYLKNTLGASLAPVIAALTPVVERLAGVFIAASNAINQFFSALGGHSTFTKAKKYATEYADAVGGASGAVAELKRQVLGFDELNVLNGPSGGGGGAAANQLDFSEMFEEADIDGRLKGVTDKLREIGARLKELGGEMKINFSDVLFKWDNLTSEDIAKKLESGIYTIMGGIVGFALGGPLGALVGSIVGFGLSLLVEAIDFDNNGTLSQDEVLSMVKRVGVAMTGAAIGWALGGPKGALIGLSVASGLTTLIDALEPEDGGKVKAALFVASLIAVLGKMLLGTGLKAGAAAALGLSSGGAIIGFAALAGLGLTLATLGDFKNGMGNKYDYIVAGLVEVLNLAAGAAIGFTIGGVPGAVIGIAIAAGLNLLINKVDWQLDGKSKAALDAMEIVPDQAAIDAYNNGTLDEYNTAGKTPKEKKKLLQVKMEADGGYVPSGSLFWAGEAGPELVGQVNGRTNVTNQEQFTAGMEGIMDNTNSVIVQAAQMIVAAFNAKDMNVNVNLSDRDIYKANKRGAFQYGTAMVK